MPDLPPSRRLRLKFAVIGAIGGAMVLLPLGQVLRYQNADLEALVAERTTLDPLTHALAVQHGLLGHRDAAERVLRGRQQLEAERQLRKAEVDASLWALRGTLSAGYWVRALDESNALTRDWHTLASRVALHQVPPTESRASHQLLLEQAVQVMDLVSAAAPAGSYAQLLNAGRMHIAGSPLAPAQADMAEAVSLPRLAAVGQALRAHSAAIDERSAALKEQRAMVTVAGAVLAVMAALSMSALGLLIRATQPGPLSPPPEAGGAVRRSLGRRRSDPETAGTPSQQLMQRLRKTSAVDTVDPPESRSPSA